MFLISELIIFLSFFFPSQAPPTLCTVIAMHFWHCFWSYVICIIPLVNSVLIQCRQCAKKKQKNNAISSTSCSEKSTNESFNNQSHYMYLHYYQDQSTL